MTEKYSLALGEYDDKYSKLEKINIEIAMQTRNIANELYRQNELSKLKMQFECGELGRQHYIQRIRKFD